MNKLYIILGTAIIILILIRVYVRANRMGGFEGFADTNSSEVIIAKASWCGHCKTAMPEFNKLVGMSPKLKDGSSVTIRMIDEKENKDEVQALGVRGFPTIIFFNKGERIEYDGPRTADGVISFLQGY